MGTLRDFPAEVSNGVLRELVEKLAVAGLSPQSIVNYSRVVKMVVASAVDSNGEQVHPRKWNHDFIGIPIVRKELQHRPTVTEMELSAILSNAKGRYAVLFSLLAGTGIRIGEAWRREWCERAGLGFSPLGLLGLQNAEQLISPEAA